MTEMTLYHNPRCSKSRAALELLQSRGLNPAVVRYLETPLSEDRLATLVDKLGVSARSLLRKGEEEYQALGLAASEVTEEQIIKAMAMHPKLIERPILETDTRAVVGRPPERVLELCNE